MAASNPAWPEPDGGRRRPALCVRWTIGDVSPAGFEALRLSVHGAYRLFGGEADYHICVNTVPVATAAQRTGPLPPGICWHAVPPFLPEMLRRVVDSSMTEGTAWKFVPLQICPQSRELALDNDVILWDMPAALRAWLESTDPNARLIAGDMVPACGRFAPLCGPAPRNSGIRGTPAGFDLEHAIARVLDMMPGPLESELDEQGLQIAALSLDGPPLVVSTGDVSICSPFPPHTPEFGACGAHFVGLNARSLPWEFYGRPATQVRLEHWRQHRPELFRRVGLPLPEDEDLPRMEAGE